MAHLHDHPFFFNNETGFEREKQLFANIMDETIFLHGAECIWVSVSLNQLDDTFGEFLGKLITEGTPIRLHVDQIDTDFYPEDGGLHDKFGFTPQIGEASFNATVQYFTHHEITPKAQDLILYKKVNKIFEVTHVQLLDGFKYKISAVLYDYDHTKVDKDVTDAEIASLSDLADKDKILENDTIRAQEVLEKIVNSTEKDGIFD